jgi:tRNA threonylcarbamoyladenosine modification (KEOPS) complex Cgi121 subunit
MDAHHPVPWFPSWGIKFSEPIENVFSVVSIINEWRSSNRWMILAYEAVASEIHLWTAWYALRKSEDSGEMVAKTPDAEFLRLISGTRQINKAFERAGVAVDDECAWIVMLPDSEIGDGFGEFSIPLESYNDATEEAIRLIEHLGGSLMPSRPTPSTSGLERIGSDYSSESSITEIEDYFLSHIALSDLR